MKPAERAIEIVAVGLGQAGGNLAAEFFRRGYGAVAFNTATTDLSSLSQSVTPLPEEFRLYIGLKGYDGAGSDIAYGRECIRVHAEHIRDHVSSHAAHADVLLITTGLGGGTGSAVSELVRELADLSIPMLVLATLPTGHESGIAKVNAMRAMNELVKETRVGVILVDNAQLALQHGDVSYDRYYTEINRMIVEPIEALNRLNSRTDISAIRSLDGEDYRTLLMSTGMLGFATVTLAQLNGDAMMDALRNGLLSSDIQPEGYHLDDVSYLAAVIEAPEHMLSETPFSFFEHLSEQLKEETGGAAVFLGVYRTTAPRTHATLRVLASSQTLPDGVAELLSQAKREGGELQAKLKQVPRTLSLGEVEDFQLFRTGPGAVRRRMQEPKNGDDVLHVAAASPSSSQVAALPDRSTYDVLAKQFEEAETDEIKRRVSARLENDQNSANSLVRYYAVRTMSKLDPGVFASALQRATQDEDATVRAVAMRALNRE